MENERPAYVLTVRAKSGVDSIQALRAWLKIGLRRFGLECVGITPENMETNMVDMRKYASTYVKPDEVRNGPIQARIVNVFESEQYNRPVLELETGSQFTLNETNTNTLIKAWGSKSEDWIGQEIELALGTYKDWRDDPPTQKETVRARAISPAQTGNGSTAAKPPLPISRTATTAQDLEDEIPF
jgi:hypothetical protein